MSAAPMSFSKTDPFNDYGQSKLEGEDVLNKWAAGNAAAILTIVRPVVVFGEANRGNVYTLINQVASGKFLMIGDGENKKSMAYVGNVAAFLRHCLDSNDHSALYNYADGPDYSMNTLMDVDYVTAGKTRPAIRLPRVVGMAAGHALDLLARATKRTFPISAIRVQKFCADTTSNAAKSRRTGFVPPYTLDEGIARMIAHDFKRTA